MKAKFISESLKNIFKPKRLDDVNNGANVHERDDLAIRRTFGNIGLIKLLLSYGANPHANNDEVLRMAKKYYRSEVIELLENQP